MIVTVTTFGSAEYLRHVGLSTDGELVFHNILPRRALVVNIQKATAKYFGIPLAEMTSSRRSRDVARPRQVAMYLAKHLTPKSLPEIGRCFHRDHTTVIHALRQIEKLIETDAEIAVSVKKLAWELRG